MSVDMDRDMTDEKNNTDQSGGHPEPANDTAPIRRHGYSRMGASELEAARAEAAQLKDQLLRALAETENVRRRAQREREDAGKYAIANFARDVLQVSDNLHRALEAIPASALAEDEALRNFTKASPRRNASWRPRWNASR